ncbi:uncharacterized protein EV154DRAFT_554186 [Mucor mucedo]|uniref:uncharacterized protein n=1 Tax=Mucor mucedo TaxID=29922 RepID=UPI0022203A07|nr:uncharacterized protein EV154DRAFT_554186 [Mucor mucedo]KAI7888036.1 hypothetical protein EV154DRAFT_554186 [Mucor mucedo]
MGIKPFISIDLKEDRAYYQDESIPIVISLRLEKEWSNPSLFVSFKGYASSYKNSTRQHNEKIFEDEKSIPIENYDKQPYNMTYEIDHIVKVDEGKEIPSSKDHEGGNGGKIEYMIEVRLESIGFFGNTKPLARQIIIVKLLEKLDISKNRLIESQKSTDYWPVASREADMCQLSAYIPREGWLRGASVEVQIDFKQPVSYNHVSYVTVELISQESIALAKDSVLDLSYKLNEKIISKDTRDVEMHSTINRMRVFNQQIYFSLLPELIPTISTSVAKVVNLNYKLRVSVVLPGKNKNLRVDLPLVIGTTTTLTSEPNNKPHTRAATPNMTEYQDDPGEYTTDSDRSSPCSIRCSECALPFTLTMPQPPVYYHNCPEDYLQAPAEGNTYFSPASSTAYMSPIVNASSASSPTPYHSANTSGTSRTYECFMQKPASRF